MITVAPTVSLMAITGLPEMQPGDDLGLILCDALDRLGLLPRDGDIFAIAQKVVSKAEGRFVDLDTISPSKEAMRIAAEVNKDPRLVEVVLAESNEIVRHKIGVLVVEHRLGFVLANGGVDHSNVDQSGRERVLLLPKNPDASCQRVREQIQGRYGVMVGVIINDSFGRPWRMGVVGTAIGVAGLPALVSLVGRPDRFGRAMRVTEVALADELAAAASLVMGQSDEGRPVVLIRGVSVGANDDGAAALLRPRTQDMFR